MQWKLRISTLNRNARVKEVFALIGLIWKDFKTLSQTLKEVLANEQRRTSQVWRSSQAKGKPLVYSARWLLTAWSINCNLEEQRNQEILKGRPGVNDKQPVRSHLSYITEIREQDISAKCHGLSEIGLSCSNCKWKRNKHFLLMHLFSKH